MNLPKLPKFHEMVYKKLSNDIKESIKQEFRAIRETIDRIEQRVDEETLQTYPLGKVEKLLKMSRQRILYLVETGQLTAISYRIKEKTYYRFTIHEIKKFMKRVEVNRERMRIEEENRKFPTPKEILEEIKAGTIFQELIKGEE